MPTQFLDLKFCDIPSQTKENPKKTAKGLPSSAAASATSVSVSFAAAAAAIASTPKSTADRIQRVPKTTAMSAIRPDIIPITLSEQEILKRNRQFDGPWCHNVVATASFCEKQPPNMAYLIGGSQNGTHQSSICMLRLRDPACTAVVYQSGVVSLTGTHSECAAKLAFMEYALYVGNRTGVYDIPRDIQIRNVLGTAYTGYTVDLTILNSMLTGSSMLSEESDRRGIGALRYDIKKPDSTILIFPTGSCVITGCRNEADLRQSVEIMKPVLAHAYLAESTKEKQAECKKAAKLARKVEAGVVRSKDRTERVRKKLKQQDENGVKASVTKGDLSGILGVYAFQVEPLCKSIKGGSSCKHKVAVVFSKDSRPLSLGHLGVPDIEQLISQNNLPAIIHTPLGFIDDSVESLSKIQ